MSELSVLFQSVKLPVMPEVAQALIRTMHDEDVDMETVQKILSKDPTLTAKVLQFANSAGFGVRREINSLQSAMSIVGLAKVRTIALSACMNVAFPVVPGLDRTLFWKNCMATAGYAQWLAQQLGMEAQQAWLGGLMVRLGELLIGMHKPTQVSEIEQLPIAPGERWRREFSLLGFSETQVTAELAHRWRFPAELIKGIEATGDPMRQEPFNRLGGVLHLAGWLSEMKPEELQTLETLPDNLLHALALTRSKLLETLPSADSFVDLSSL
jgi:HD-like signal output (HDOD) protein